MSNRKIDNLREPSNLQLKVKTGYPTAIDAKEGVVTLRYIPGTGLALFAYYANRWSMTKLSNLNAKDESIVENLKVKNLEIDKSAKFNASSVDISEKNIPSIKKWDKSYNDIRSGEIEANFKKTKVKEDLQIGPDNSKILLKNNNNKLNIRNADDSADIQLEIGYGGTGASTADTALDNLGGTTVGKNVFKAADQAAARSALNVNVAGTDNSTPVTIASGKDYISLSGQELTLGSIDLTSDVTGTLPTSNTAAKCTDANADQTSVNNAASATVLETARDIGGVSFNGSASINLPGVNTAGNQNTSGIAAEATILETSRTIFGNSFNGSANVSGDAIIGNGSGDATVRGNGNNDLILRTSNSVTTNNQSKITLGDGSSADITFSTPRSIIADKPIGFTHYALSDISEDAATLDFNFGANGNKIRVAFTTASATISEARLVFPTNISGNYTVIVKNHTSAITKNEITLWTSSFGTAGTDKVNVKWPNNTIPSVTESDHSRIDIFSFYWDCNDKIAYGVSTLNFYSS
jgi:hypothetical protein